jgi:hypothetical protein
LLKRVRSGIPELTGKDEEKDFYRKYGDLIKTNKCTWSPNKNSLLGNIADHIDLLDEDFPVGFPQLAAFMKSDDDMAMARSFDQVHFRILLQLQVELTQLESAVHELDKSDEENEAMRYRLMKTYKEGWDIEKPNLIDEMKKKTKEYGKRSMQYLFGSGIESLIQRIDEFLLNFSRIKALGPPRPHNYRSLFRWIFMKGPLAPGYESFILHEKDFVALTPSSEYGKPLDRSNYFEEKVLSHVRNWRNSPFRV